jgi:hypothetical protein
VIAAFRTPFRRILLAIALSVLIHAAILWLPYVQFPQQTRVQLPPLSVRLEPLSKPDKVIPEKPLSAKQQSTIHLTKTEDSASAKPETNAMPAMNRTAETLATQPLPKQLQLRFTVYKGADGFRIGEILQEFDIHGDRYTLKSERQTSGLASLRNSDRLIQTSRGRIGEHGLRPEIFDEQKIGKGGEQTVQVTFDQTAGKLRYSNGGETALPADAQDVLSFMYQLSQVPMNVEFFSLPVSDGEQLHQYQIEIGTKEDLSTPIGKLRTLHLRKMHTHGETHFDIWLGLEYRLLPVKFSLVDGSDNVTEEYVISDIRAADQ